MELYFKKPSKEAKKAMCESIIHNSLKNRNKYINAAKNEISNITEHEHVSIVNSGNSAILAAMSAFKDKILIPDQGGWIGFKKIAEFLNLETTLVPTKLGIIDPDVLHETIKKHSPEAIFITSFAGYIAEQPVKHLYEICNDNGVILVEDASGAVGDIEGKLANGNHAHIIIASTGFPKIVNVGNGGFISTNNYKIFENTKTILKTVKACPITCVGISEEIKKAQYTLKKTIESCDFIKRKVKSIFNKDRRGITIALPADDPKRIGHELRRNFNVNGKSIITICPRYERIMTNAVCIEIKNLDLECLKHDNLNKMVKIINKVT